MPKTLSDPKIARHEEYKEQFSQWQKCRDADGGQRAIKEGARTYLPQLTGQNEAEYARYLLRALFFNATSRTVTGLTGAVMRKPTVIEYPAGQADDLDEIGRNKEGARDMIARTVHAQLLVGRVGHLVDAAPEGDEASPEPYIVEYAAETIWNWRTELVNNRWQLVMVALHETFDVPDPQGGLFAVKKRDRWRVLKLGNAPALEGGGIEVVDTGSGLQERFREPELVEGFSSLDAERGFYFQEIWVRAIDDKGEETDELVLEQVIVPRKIGGRLWEEIPFTITNTASTEACVEVPPLIDLVDVNISHYQNSADLEHGRHFTALPTPYIIGGDPKQKIPIGSTTAWIIPTSDAKVGMLEFTGAGLGHLQRGMEHKEKMMAVLGSRLLEDQKTGVEAAEAVKLRLSGDGAILNAIAMTCGESWAKLLQWYWEWRNTSEASNITVTVNNDFNPARLPSDELQSLMAALQSGTIDFETWYYNLERGDMLPPGTTIEKFGANLIRGAPNMLAAPEPDDADDDPDDDDDEGDDPDDNDGDDNQ